MIYEHHKEKRHWPAALFLAAIAAACALAPTLPRTGLILPEPPKIDPAKNPVYKVPFAAADPLEPAAGLPATDE